MKRFIPILLLVTSFLCCCKESSQDKVRDLISTYSEHLVSGNYKDALSIYPKGSCIVDSSLNDFDLTSLSNLSIDSIAVNDSEDPNESVYFYVYSRIETSPVEWTVERNSNSDYNIVNTSGLFMPNLKKIGEDFGMDISLGYYPYDELTTDVNLSNGDLMNAMVLRILMNGIPKFKKFMEAVEKGDAAVVASQFPDAKNYISRMPLGKPLNIKMCSLCQDENYGGTALCFQGDNGMYFEYKDKVIASKYFIPVEDEEASLRNAGINPDDIYRESDLRYINTLKERLNN